MKKLVIFAFLPFAIVNSFCQNIVDGHVYLEFQSVHTSVKVVFERTIPSVLADSTYSDSKGLYSITLEDGVYNITYSKNNYITKQIIDQGIYSDTTLPDLILKKFGLSGSLSGTITSGTYPVDANIQVDSNDTLNILQGAHLLFKQDVQFDIYGYLSVAGCNSDSVVFTSYDSLPSWNGLIFNQNSDGHLSHIIIKKSKNSGVRVFNSTPVIENSKICYNYLDASNQYYKGGAGIFMSNSNVTLSNVSVSNNQLVFTTTCFEAGGGGIFINGASPILDRVKISNNILISTSNSLRGGGIYCIGGSPIIRNSIISNNTGARDGGGISCFYTTGLEIENTAISFNSCLFDGGAIYYNSTNTNMTVTNSLVNGNSAGKDGGGIYCAGYDVRIYNSTITNNEATDEAGGIFITAMPQPVIVNTIISWNKNHGLFNSGSSYPSVINCNLFGNTNGNLHNCGPSIGYNLKINNNGDSCDMFENIQIDPLFTDRNNHNYHLIASSPCIDAGINDSVFTAFDLEGNPRLFDHNLDGDTIVDIGTYEVIISPQCLNGGIIFTTQTQIDNFKTDYLSCTEILGNIQISGPLITNLDSLDIIAAIDGNIIIKENDYLYDLSGLRNLTTINGNVRIEQNAFLSSLYGLENIDPSTVNYLKIHNNPSLSVCEVLSICNYLEDTATFFQISDNSNGCNSMNEIDSACSYAHNNISGRLEYADTLTPHQAIGNTLLKLYSADGILVDSSVTGHNGEYIFEDISNGNYYIEPVCYKLWGGGGMSDALLIMRYWAGMEALSGINLKSADVNASGSVNSLDALYIAQRIVSIINSFPAGEWVFEQDTITVNGADVVHNIKGLCVGDVNASFVVPYQ